MLAFRLVRPRLSPFSSTDLAISASNEDGPLPGSPGLPRVRAADLQSLADAKYLADAANRDLAGGARRYVGVDGGPGVWPRYSVVRAFQVGEAVSYGFNGDSYPDGEVVSVRITATAEVVTTSTGNKYRRRLAVGSRWSRVGCRTWSLSHGHNDERNPHF